ncbi:MAG: sigma-70 family RNA polymerase sigma factor [Pirellulales bacterium]
MALSDLDRNLLRRCLSHEAGAWEDLVDRFLGLVLHVIDHTASHRQIELSSADREDLASEVFLGLVQHDYGALRRFRGQSSLATYLTVISRRIALRQLSRLAPQGVATVRFDEHLAAADGTSWGNAVSDREQIAHLLDQLSGDEAEVVRLFHLEGQSYHEISRRTGLPENSVGPTLSRARTKMRQALGDRS